MGVDPKVLVGFAAALGSGLLIGIERERRKGFGASRALAGVRTFTLASLTGAAAGFIAAPLLTFTGGVLIATLGAISHWRSRSRDPGVTTEIALFITYLVGLIAIDHPAVAAGSAVVIAALLTARRALHEFSVTLLSEGELRDGLLFAALALIVMPLLPDSPIQWLGAGPRTIFALVVTFMGLQAAGYVALRVAGSRFGLAFAGLASGFVSSTGTIAALGSRARSDRKLLGACVSGAMFSCIATVLLLAIVVGAVYPRAFLIVGPSLAMALLAAIGAAGIGLWRQPSAANEHRISGRPFNLGTALGFAGILVGVTATMGFVNSRYGSIGRGITAAITGIFDVHASATSTLSLAANGALAPPDILLPILVAFSTNTVSKLVAAFAMGGPRYGWPVALGLGAIVTAAWLPAFWVQ
ncbi:MAG TPA: DUF4010 domain-containing protein [Steroidobacteraceae bacterium]